METINWRGFYFILLIVAGMSCTHIIQVWDIPYDEPTIHHLTPPDYWWKGYHLLIEPSCPMRVESNEDVNLVIA